MRIIESYVLGESFKDAELVFTKQIDRHGFSKSEIRDLLRKFRELRDRGVIKGPNADITNWYKRGGAGESKSFEAFRKFVKQKAEEARFTRTQTKKGRRSGEAIVLKRTSDYIIVIPLNFDASRHFGRNTKWCVSKNSADWHSYFMEDNEVIVMVREDDEGNYTHGGAAAMVYDILDKRVTEFRGIDDELIDGGDFEAHVDGEVTTIEIQTEIQKHKSEIMKAMGITNDSEMYHKLIEELQGGRYDPKLTAKLLEIDFPKNVDAAIHRLFLKYVNSYITDHGPDILFGREGDLDKYVKLVKKYANHETSKLTFDERQGIIFVSIGMKYDIPDLMKIAFTRTDSRTIDIIAATIDRAEEEPEKAKSAMEWVQEMITNETQSEMLSHGFKYYMHKKGNNNAN